MYLFSTFIHISVQCTRSQPHLNRWECIPDCSAARSSSSLSSCSYCVNGASFPHTSLVHRSERGKGKQAWWKSLNVTVSKGNCKLPVLWAPLSLRATADHTTNLLTSSPTIIRQIWITELFFLFFPERKDGFIFFLKHSSLTYSEFCCLSLWLINILLTIELEIKTAGMAPVWSAVSV